MSHNIHYITCEENVSRSRIMGDIAYHAEKDGDGYHSKFTWHDEVPPLDSLEKAEEFIKKVDNGWYDDHAVRYKDFAETKKTAKVVEYEEKVLELSDALKRYCKEHSVHMLAAKHIGCPMCGSKLNKEYLIGEACPLCKFDLRSKTTLDKIKWYQDKIKDYRKRAETERAKQKRGVTIKWLIKYEYHS